MEFLVAACDRLGITTGIEGWKLQDVAGDIVVPLMELPSGVDLHALALDCLGVCDGSLLVLSQLTGVLTPTRRHCVDWHRFHPPGPV